MMQMLLWRMVVGGGGDGCGDIFSCVVSGGVYSYEYLCVVMQCCGYAYNIFIDNSLINTHEITMKNYEIKQSEIN